MSLLFIYIYILFSKLNEVFNLLSTNHSNNKNLTLYFHQKSKQTKLRCSTAWRISWKRIASYAFYSLVICWPLPLLVVSRYFFTSRCCQLSKNLIHLFHLKSRRLNATSVRSLIRDVATRFRMTRPFSSLVRQTPPNAANTSGKVSSR